MRRSRVTGAFYLRSAGISSNFRRAKARRRGCAVLESRSTGWGKIASRIEPRGGRFLALGNIAAFRAALGTGAKVIAALRAQATLAATVKADNASEREEHRASTDEEE